MWRDEHSLYPYQRRAADTMVEADTLLAFEMGCGKTPTTLFALEALREKYGMGCGTVVVPSSIKGQWAREIEKFTDQKALVIDGPLAKRRKQYETIPDHGYMIISYTAFVSDWEWLGDARSFLVLDEATAIKSYNSKRTRHIKKVRNRYPVRFALTGTPVENGKAEEIFSIMEFVDPEVLGSFWRFERKYIRRSQFGWVEGYRNLDELHRILRPYVLRATHKQPEVSRYLPTVLSRDPYLVKMDRKTKAAVRTISDRISADLDSIADSVLDEQWRNSWRSDHPDGELMSKIQVLRMLLDHPSAVLASASMYDEGGGSAFAFEVMMDGLLEGLGAPKMDAAVAYVKDHLDASPENKVVMFATFLLPARKLCETLATSGAVLFHGGLSSKERDTVLRRFVSDPDCRVFVSTDAGGYGLDLPQANLLINFDLPWQAGLLQQRNARIRRASSQWPYVVVQDFIVEGTIEERIRSMLDQKIGIAESLVDGEDTVILSDIGSLRSFLAATKEH